MEPQPLKTAPLWWLVAINYISSFFLAGLLVGIVGIAIFMQVPLEGEGSSDLMIQIMLTVAYLLALWLMTWNAARFLRSRYVIPNPKKVVQMTLLVAVILSVIGVVLDYTGAGLLPDPISLVLVVVELGLFYYLSSKYLRA